MTNDWSGLQEALNIAVSIGRGDGNAGVPYGNMLVSHSPDGEYTSSYDVKAEKVQDDKQGEPVSG